MENKITSDLVKRYFSGDCSTAEEIFVESWLVASPDNTKQAMQWLEEFPEREEQLVAQVLDSQQAVWEKTVNKLLYSKKKEEVNRFLLKSNKKIIRVSNTQKHWLVAASILCGLISISFAITYYWKNQEISVQAGFGQIKQVTLPDNSLVYLNGNSKLIYNPNWQGKEREVWLDGEAFFNVVHVKDYQKFTVHLSGQMDIEVLGTEFNVFSRKQEKSIVLKSGKIKLKLQENKSIRNVYLKPGELATTKSLKFKKIYKKVVNPELYYGWIKHKWVLDNTPLEEMLLKLKETYGITAIVKDRALIERCASGSIPLSENNVQLLICDIANIFELTIQTKGDSIFLEAAKGLHD